MKALNNGCARYISWETHFPSLSLSLRICGLPVKVILQTQQRLKGRGEGRGGIGRRALERKRGESEGASRQSYKLIALRSDCSFLCINPCSLASPLARSLFPRHCCLSESSCPHSPFFFSPSCNVVDPKLGTDFGGHKRSNLPLLGTIQNS